MIRRGTGRSCPSLASNPTQPRRAQSRLELLCRNRGASFKYLAHTIHGLGPNPHRTLLINGWNGYGLHAQFLAPGDQKDNEMMCWIPRTRDEAETLYMYQVKLRRPR